MPSSPEINRWNEQWRATPQYREILTAVGANPDKPNLSDRQRKQVQSRVEQAFGFTFPKGTEIDPAANWNENEGVGKYAKDWRTYAIAGGAALGGLGLAGMGPLGFLGGSAAAPAAGGSVASGVGGAAAPGLGLGSSGLFLPATGIGSTAAATGAATALPVAATAAGTGAAGMFGLPKSIADAISLGGTVAGGISRSKGEQRAARADAASAQEYLKQAAERNYFDALLAREQEKRAASGDAWKRLLQSDYVSNYQPAALNLTPYSKPIQGPSAGMKQTAADPMMQELLKRQVSGQYDPYGGATPVRSPDFAAWNAQMDPGLFEDLMGYVGGYGAWDQMRRQPQWQLHT